MDEPRRPRSPTDSAARAPYVPDAAPTGEDAPHDEETDEALARAAREAVRQPPDPRLERSFAHLALERDERSPAVSGPRAPDARASLEADVGRIRDEIAAWRTSTERLGRQLEIVTWTLVAVAAVFALLALVVLVRGLS